jgi:hypothetical protein
MMVTENFLNSLIFLLYVSIHSSKYGLNIKD